MERESKSSELKEIINGSFKGLISTTCRISIVGQPAAEGIYKTIKSEPGKNAYWAVHGMALGALGITAAYYLAK